MILNVSGMSATPFIHNIWAGILTDPDTQQPDGYGFTVDGGGFLPGTAVTIAWKFVYHYGHNGKSLQENPNADSSNVNPDGTFSSTCKCYPLGMQVPGTLTVQATDSDHDLQAYTSIEWPISSI